MSKNSNPARSTAGGFNRRSFLKGGASVLSFAALQASFQTLMAPSAFAANDPIASPYGPPVPTADLATGLNLIQIPRGFSYRSFGWTGDLMDEKDGQRIPTPSLHDGMGIISKGNDAYWLVRNHEQSGGTAFHAPAVYSPNSSGGTTNILFDARQGKFIRSYPSLSGTWRNCAGGVTPWGSWITCEEVGPTQTTGGGLYKHGYCFEVELTGGNPEPLRDMGRFAHEAATVDPESGYVYLTEDGPSASGDAGSGFYRFIPNKKGVLKKGGKLQMMKLANTPRFITGGLSYGAPTMAVEWVDVPNPDPNFPVEPSTFQQGFLNGGASFVRLEGCWYGDGKIVFLSTSGGPAEEGQVFSYDIANATLEVIFVSTAQSILENPDNMTIAPDSSLLLCEDNAGGTANAGERLLFVTPASQIFEFAMNNMDFRTSALGPYTRPGSGITFTGNQRQNEWAGACFSPDGKWLFVNNQTPGMTFAITGPWTWL